MNEESMPRSPWINREQFADRIGVPENTVKWWAATGKGPKYRKFGRHVRYHIDDVLEWENQQTVRR